ncbi:hypothetical protein MNBD_GAMMA22-485 [hydrothermal vent metagenome]|uniref:Uncharacterized protein n=1 Tax=hydrothermal vent metagenome TaxID=652676 RepID=A0A3B0ZZQ9_9ZZZZ
MNNCGIKLGTTITDLVRNKRVLFNLAHNV